MIRSVVETERERRCPPVAPNGEDVLGRGRTPVGVTDPTVPSDIAPLRTVDAMLRRHLAALSADDPDFWTFLAKSEREDAHGFFQYPAMMVPRVQRELLRLILQLQKGVRSVLDPFAGSGTILSEAMYAGLEVCAQDVNPLAVLLCRAKAGPFVTHVAKVRVGEVERTVDGDRSERAEGEFPRLTKWFEPQAIVELSRLRRAIRRVPERWVRRLLWVTLAETVRLTSNSRTSTYKLHVRPADEIKQLSLPIETFKRLVDRNLQRHASFAAALEKAGHLVGSEYTASINCRLGDSRLPIEGPFDLLVTSPPYGDNTSTVPYGQASYLPLQWIDLTDVDAAAAPDYLNSTYEIDTRSLGGRRPRGDLQKLTSDLRERSPAFRNVLSELASAPRDRTMRVFSFVRDLNQCLGPITDSLRPNAYLIWTVGNRRVGGIQVPLDAILEELLAHHRVTRVTAVDRRIPTKRMATRNSIASTMRAEHILVFRKLADRRS